MEKILLTNLNSRLLPPKQSVDGGEAENPNTIRYIRRKNMQPAYQELFKALLRLPDRHVQARVLDAINDNSNRLKPTEIVQTCDKCKQQKIQRRLVDVGTQTAAATINTPANSMENKANTITSNSDDSASTTPSVDNSIVETEKSTDELVVKKRKQRRKVRIPLVMKKSQAKQIQQNQFIQQKRKSKTLKRNDVNEEQDRMSPASKRQRSDSLSSTEFAEAQAQLQFLESEMDSKAIIREIMIKEYQQAEEIQPDGLIPIHSAIVNDDLFKLKRQIFVWKMLMKVDLKELYTEDEEDCLQLAITENKSNCIVKTLIEVGLDVNSLDSQSNTLIHLAVLNDVDVDVIDLLMDNIDLNMLLKSNDDGFTPLHLTLRHENFLHAETILNSLDKRCFKRLFYERKSENTKKEFLRFYEKQCESLALKNSMLEESKEKQFIKQRLINAGDMRSGNTALFYAIENKMEHFIYLLLAHFADPRIENHSGQNSRTYLGEFSKILNLSLKIDRIMEQIENCI